MTNITKGGVLLLLVAGLLGACAEERDPINRVQPYALPKSFFIGDDYRSADDDPEFWAQNSIIDVGYGAKRNALFTSTYVQPMTRIKWQITKDYLLGRLAYERVNGSDGKGKATGLEKQDGIIVVSFRIEKHFDVVNSYNPTTGEEMNIVEENSYDRPWYEREYIRADFSKNLITASYDFDTLSMVGLFGGISWDPVSYFVEDPKSKDAPVFDIENGYFDVTTKALANPEVIDISHLGWWIKKIPACWFAGPDANCNPMEATLRHSFRRVEDQDFQPIDWDGWRFQAYGGFSQAERYGYARNYGMTDHLHYRFLTRQNIWERSHYYADPAAMTGPVECYTPKTTPMGADPNRDEDGNGTADECESVTQLSHFGGSQCDTFSQKCTLPFRARTAKPNVWYYSEGSNPFYFGATADATHNWDAGMRTAVRAARYAECMATTAHSAGDVGSAQESCAAKYKIYFGQQGDNEDVIQLSMEMDDCRRGRTQNCTGTAAAIQTCCEKVVDGIGAARKYSAEVIDIAKMPEMFVLCHSPVEFNDPAVCGTPEQRLPQNITAEDCQIAQKTGDVAKDEICNQALSVRMGDLRYHMVNVLNAPQTPSPWGIYTSAVDPLNGETISNTVNIWGEINTYVAQLYIDEMRFAAGELSVSEITEGEYVKDWSKAAEAAAHQSGAMTPMSTKEINKRISAVAGLRAGDKVPNLAADSKAMLELQKLKQDFTGVIADSYRVPSVTADYQGRMKALVDNGIEGTLMNRQMQELYDIDDKGLNEEILDMFSPLRGGNPTIRAGMDRLMKNAMGERGMCVLDMDDAEMVASPFALSGFSKILQKKFGKFNAKESKDQQKVRADKMIDYVARRLHTGVITHEMGHSMSHRHNFVGSSDAYNYRPQYWQLRTKNKELSGKGPLNSMTDETGESTLGPRWFDPVTKNEEDNLLWMFGHSSVMDYAGDITQDMLGPGAWDFAALRMFYGDTVAVYPTEYAPLGGVGGADGDTYAANRAEGIMLKMDSFGGILGFSDYKVNLSKSVHYSELDTYYNLIQDCEDIENVDVFKPSRWNKEADGEWSPVLDGLIVSVSKSGKRNVYSRCHQQKVDYVPWRTLKPVKEEFVPKYSDGNPAYMRATDDTLQYGSMIDRDNRVRVPYGFATDRWADIGNVAVYRHDNGSDPYETFNVMIAQKDLNHIFSYYRRGKATFTKSGAVNRMLSRYMGKMRDGAKGLTLQRNYIAKIATELGLAPSEYWAYAVTNFFPNNVLASSLVFDDFIRTYQRPEIGGHSKYGWNCAQDGTNCKVYDTIYRSTENASFNNKDITEVFVPNGAYTTKDSNLLSTFAMGGKRIENKLDPKWGEYEANYDKNCGSYYEKLWVAMMLTESVDNFISDSRGDFIDSRYRATSLADLLPAGYERWLGNALTNDEFLKGARIAADADGVPLIDSDGFIKGGLGFTKWYGDEPEACFPKNGTTVCSAVGGSFKVNLNDAPDHVAVLDSQAGWEIQKFLIALTYIYLPENEKTGWLQKLALNKTPYPDDISIPNHYEFHAPLEGITYYSTRYGQEEQFGKVVEKGIATRVLQYANELLNKAYETTEVDADGDGDVDWYKPVYNAEGRPIVRYDLAMTNMYGQTPGSACNETDNSGCECDFNRACIELKDYMSVIQLLNTMTRSVSVGQSQIGVYF